MKLINEVFQKILLCCVILVFCSGCLNLKLASDIIGAGNQFKKMVNDEQQVEKIVGTWRYADYGAIQVRRFDANGNMRESQWLMSKVYYNIPNAKAEGSATYKISKDTLATQPTKGFMVPSFFQITFVDDTHFYLGDEKIDSPGLGLNYIYTKLSDNPDIVLLEPNELFFGIGEGDLTLHLRGKELQVIDITRAFEQFNQAYLRVMGVVPYFEQKVTIYSIDGKEVNITTGKTRGTYGTFYPVEAGSHTIKWTLESKHYNTTVSGELNYIQKENETTYFKIEVDDENVSKWMSGDDFLFRIKMDTAQ
jgi:hypothetical protein